MRPIYHIGLPKTSTTFVQRTIVPVINQCTAVLESDHVCFRENVRIASSVALPLCQKCRDKIAKVRFFSLESMVGWNPKTWVARAYWCQQNLPQNSTILLTIREPRELIRSVYVQKIQEGGRAEPLEFFGLKTNLHGSSSIEDLFDLSLFDYKTLISLYCNFFKEVIVATDDVARSPRFYSEILMPDLEPLKNVKIDGSSLYNRSVGSLGVKLLKGRTNLLELLGREVKTMVDLNYEYFRSVVNEESLTPFCCGDWRKSRPLRNKYGLRSFLQNILPIMYSDSAYVLPVEIMQSSALELSSTFFAELEHAGGWRRFVERDSRVVQ